VERIAVNCGLGVEAHTIIMLIVCVSDRR
jgi:hypothetical protein